MDNRYGRLITPDIKLHRKWFDEMVRLVSPSVRIFNTMARKQRKVNPITVGELKVIFNLALLLAISAPLLTRHYDSIQTRI